MKQLLSGIFLSVSFITFGQTFTKLTVKCGPSFSGQIKTIKGTEDRGMIIGSSGAIEPTILTFGSKKQIDFNIDISFIQKGGQIKAIENPNSPEGGLGTYTYPITMNYFSCSPTIKINFAKFLFTKFGPRVDVFSNAYSRRFPEVSNFKSDLTFNSLTYGVTYSFGISTGKNRRKFFCEIIGQNDFTKSIYYKAAGQTFINFSYILNFGVTFSLKKSNS